MRSKRFEQAIKDLKSIPSPKIMSIGCGDMSTEIAAFNNLFSKYEYQGFDTQQNFKNKFPSSKERIIKFTQADVSDIETLEVKHKLKKASIDIMVLRHPDFNSAKFAFKKILQTSIPYFLKPQGILICSLMDNDEVPFLENFNIQLQYELEKKTHNPDPQLDITVKGTSIPIDQYVYRMRNKFFYDENSIGYFKVTYESQEKVGVEDFLAGVFKSCGAKIIGYGEGYFVLKINKGYGQHLPEQCGKYNCKMTCELLGGYEQGHGSEVASLARLNSSLPKLCWSSFFLSREMIHQIKEVSRSVTEMKGTCTT